MSFLRNGCFVGAAILALAGPGLRAGYGDYALASGPGKVPPGWGVIEIGRPQPGGSASWVLRDLNGAAFQDEAEVLAGSPIPLDWVITAYLKDLAKGAHRYRLQYVGGAPEGHEVWIHSHSPVPAGWKVAKMRWSRPNHVLLRYQGAEAGEAKEPLLDLQPLSAAEVKERGKGQ